jgi:hypothetical protein
MAAGPLVAVEMMVWGCDGRAAAEQIIEFFWGDIDD